MSIRIQRNENANAITFQGSSQPAYWNNCLAGEVNDTDNTRINVLNTVRTTDSDSPVYEFFAVPYTEFRTALGTTFTDAAECAAYITEQANATAIGIIEFGATDTVDFSRDATNTTILASTGHSYSVNSIKAVAEADGTISIKENVSNGTDVMRTIRKANVTFSGQTQGQQLNSVVNSLNALFTVNPVGLGAEDRFISNTYESDTASVATFGDVTITTDVATKGTNTGSEFNDGFYTTSDPISANGEYFEFNNTGNDPLKKMMIGLMLTSELTSSAVLEDNTVTGEDMDLAVRLKPNATYEHSPYGAVIENGFFTNPQRSDQYRAGIDNDGRLFISHFNDNSSEWQVIVRSALITANEEYSLVIFLKNENAACSTVVASKTLYTGPVMTYYYIESPDGDFYYPLFATEEEAQQADMNAGAASPGTAHQHVFVDEIPTSNIWYMPSTGGTHAGSSAPSNTADITYNVISTGDDANYAPASFTISDLTVDENTAVNYPVAPAGGSFTTTVSGLPSGLSFNLTSISGTAPEVAQFSDANPSDTFTITVTRTNSFGSTSSNFDIIVNNTTVDTTPISGFTHVSQTITLVDSDTLEAGSVVTIDNSLEQGKRMVFSAAFIQGLYDDIANSGSSHAVTIGVLKTGLYGSQWTNHSMANIQLGWRLYRESNNKYLGFVYNGQAVSNTNFGTGTFGRDLAIFHDTASNKLHVTQYGVTGGTGETMDTPTVISGSHMTPGSSDVDVTIGLSIGSSTDVDITTTGISEVDNPVVDTIVTNWNKAIDFSGSNEHLRQTNSASGTSPLRMSDLSSTVTMNTATAGQTSNSNSSRPWATACVFKIDGNSSKQHIWNQGEGTATGNDNIYLKVNASRQLHFAWGREGSGYNECLISNSLSTSTWYGVYIAHTGERLNGTNASAANLADCFDIRLISFGTNGWTLSSNLSVSANWTSTGNRMDRSFTGDFTVAGRGSNRNFHGKIASMVVTTLTTGTNLPSNAEIEEMIVDPMGWLADYKIGNTWRNTTSSYNFSNYATGGEASSRSTQIHLMGDGSSDSYSLVRNQTRVNDTSVTSLTGQNLVSSDIETVSIPGL